MEKPKNSEPVSGLMLSLYVPSLLVAISIGMLVPVLPLYADSLTEAYVLIGIFVAAKALGMMIGDIPSSMLMRRFGTKGTMLIGMFVAIAPMILLTFSGNIWIGIFLLLLYGIGHAFYNISRHAYIASAVPLEQRGRAIAFFGGVHRLGRLLGPIMGGWVAGLYGLQYTFPAVAIMALLGVGFVFQYMSQIAVNEESHEVHDKTPLIKALEQNRGLLFRAGMGQILAQLTRQGWLVIIPLYASKALNLEVETIGLIVGAGSAFDFAFFYTSGILMDRFGRKWAIVPSFLMQGLGVIAIPFTGSAIALGAVAAWIGLANGMSSGTMMTLGSDLAPPDLRGEFLAVWRLIGDTGAVGGPMVIGIVADALVLNSAILTIGGIGLCAAALFGFFVPETLKRSQLIQQIAGD